MRIYVKNGVISQRLFPSNGHCMILSEGGENKIEVSEVQASLDQVWRTRVTLLGHLDVLNDKVLRAAALPRHLLLVVDQLRDIDQVLGSLVLAAGEECDEVREECSASLDL